MTILVSTINSLTYRWEVVIVLPLLIPFVLTYLYTSWAAVITMNGKSREGRNPPTLPYYNPFSGHALSFIANGHRTILKGVRRFGNGTPFRLRLGFQDMYMVSGPDMVSALFKTARQATGNWSTLVALEYAFGASKEAIPFYLSDDSGSHTVPLPGSTTKPQDRIFYIIHKMANTYLSGQSLIGMTTRFQANLAKTISIDSRVGDEWVELPDLYGFLQAKILEAAVRSIFGDYILSLNPTFIQDFWAWERGVRQMFMQKPRWMVPRAYRSRDKMLENVKRWHCYALEHYDVSNAEEDGVEWEPYFGSKFARVRQLTFLKFKALDDTSRAAEDLGVIWGANANVIPASAWLLIETLRDPTLESRVRSELQSLQSTPTPGISSSSNTPTFDIATLCSSNLLQSMYAETLRIYARIIPTRVSVVPSMNLNGWIFAKGEMVACSSSIEAMDENNWNTGNNNENPLEKFWAERFIVYPDIEGSGPVKISRKTKSGTKSDQKLEQNGDSKRESTEQSKPRFSTEGLSATWIPYGGGVRLCPGRHFAKQEMITNMAIWLSAYDIELLSAKEGKSIREGAPPGDFQYEANMSYYGMGTCPPKGPVRCRMRRRKVQA